MNLRNSTNTLSRRQFLQTAAVTATTAAAVTATTAATTKPKSGPKVRTVLGPVDASELGVTLMHEHAPAIDWAELYEIDPAPIDPVRQHMLDLTVKLLDRFHQTLGSGQGPGAIVECTPIRVGRYPQLLVELARKTPIHVIACTGFWCEAMAPQHPWALELGRKKNADKRIADLYIREITEGMEDPYGEWGRRFTKVPVGIIKCATSSHLRPSERVCHIAAAIASNETGCPITTHTTDGGGLEEAQLFLKHKTTPSKIIIGHQGNLDDRTESESHEYHRRLVGMGCNVQFDRIGHAEKYGNTKIARLVKPLVDSGHVRQIFFSHDNGPYFNNDYTGAKGTGQDWKITQSDYTVVTTGLVKAMKELGITDKQIQTMLVENPQRILAF
ncbi:MAG: twin-arginine translocation signal domain-containing protein [Planctomycetaceae bacterium]